MPDTIRKLSLVMAATAVVLHVWVPDAASDEGGAGRGTTDHIIIGLTQSSSLSVLVEDEEIPASPVSTSDVGIAEFSVDDTGLPPGALLVRMHGVGALVLTGAEVTDVTTTTAVVEWVTDLPANSRVEYGETQAYGSWSPLDPALVTDHAVQLTGLTPGTTYHCRAVSEDGQGRVARSSDQEFTTLAGPLEITEVGVEDVGATWAVVTWNTDRPADSQVEYGFTPAYGLSTPVDPGPVTEHTVLLTGLDPGSTYHFRVLSDDGQGSSAASTDHTFRTDAETLVVFDLRILGVGSTWVEVEWATNRASDSQIEYGETDGYGHATSMDPEPVTDHVVTVTGLSPGTLYHFRARSEDGGGQVAYSEDGAVTTAVVPLTLSGLSVVDVGATWAVIEWETDRRASSLVVYGLSANYGQMEPLNQGFVTEHSTTLAGLAEGTLYHFMAISIDENEVIGVSDDSTFETRDAAPTGPPVVGGVSVVPRAATSVLVTWTTDRPATSQVRYGTAGVLDRETRIDTTLVVDHSAVVEPVVPAIEYSFVVVSACGADTTVWGPLTFETPRPPEEDLSEREVTITRPGVPSLSDTTAIVRWSTDRACSTWVEWGPDPTYGSSSEGCCVAGFLYEANVAHLQPATTYHYRVCALSEHGTVAVGDDRTFETPASADGEPPSSPEGLEGVVVGRSIELEWTPNQEGDLLGYLVYRARGGSSEGEWSREVRMTETPIGEPRYVDAGAETDAVYSYVVTAVDRSWNESVQSEGLVLAVRSDPLMPLTFAAFPNPTRAGTSFAFSVPSGECPVHLRILSPAGRVVHEIREVAGAGTRTLMWDARDQAGVPVGSGVYLCELAVGGTVARHKITLLR